MAELGVQLRALDMGRARQHFAGGLGSAGVQYPPEAPVAPAAMLPDKLHVYRLLHVWTS